MSFIQQYKPLNPVTAKNPVVQWQNDVANKFGNPAQQQNNANEPSWKQFVKTDTSVKKITTPKMSTPKEENKGDEPVYGIEPWNPSTPIKGGTLKDAIEKLRENPNQPIERPQEVSLKEKLKEMQKNPAKHQVGIGYINPPSNPQEAIKAEIHVKLMNQVIQNPNSKGLTLDLQTFKDGIGAGLISKGKPQMSIPEIHYTPVIVNGKNTGYYYHEDQNDPLINRINREAFTPSKPTSLKVTNPPSDGGGIVYALDNYSTYDDYSSNVFESLGGRKTSTPRRKSSKKTPATRTPVKRTPATRTPVKRTPATRTASRRTSPVRTSDWDRVSTRRTPPMRAPVRKAHTKKPSSRKRGMFQTEVNVRSMF